jgi:hypothetical protein
LEPACVGHLGAQAAVGSPEMQVPPIDFPAAHRGGQRVAPLDATS